MKKKISIILLYMIISVPLWSNIYTTKSFSDKIKSITAIVDGDALSEPILLLGTNQDLVISFDLISYEKKYLTYKIIHCNSDWTESAISSMEYISGFDNGSIDDYEYSINTTENYIHYKVSFPNENTQMTKSGNYVVLIAEDYEFDEPLSTVCFSITEDLLVVDGKASGNTMYEISGSFQQLEIALNYSGFQTTNPTSEFVIVVEQNGRMDNAIRLTVPTYTQVNSLIYRDKKELIFEGGNSYRVVDFSSEYTYGAGIERIVAKNNVMHVVMEPSSMRSGRGADLSLHANGKFIINKQHSNNNDVEADYMWVHFFLPMDRPIANADVLIIGDLTRNNSDGVVMMDYDIQNKGYCANVYLKQGGYNYMFGVKAKNSSVLSLKPIEGSFWQTQNNYVVKVYHKAFGERYERLLAVRTL